MQPHLNTQAALLLLLTAPDSSALTGSFMHHTQGLAARDLSRIWPWQADGHRNRGRCGVGG